MMSSRQPSAFDDYIRHVFDELQWYESAAYRAKRREVALSALQLVVIAAIPVAVSIGEFVEYGSQIDRPVVLVLSTVALVVTAYLRTLNLGPQWQQYRLLAEQLRKEYTSFAHGLRVYDEISEDLKWRLFVDRVESLRSGEMSRWFVGERREA